MLNGVKVYEEPYKFLHMKGYAIDDNYLNIGSFNHDVTSFYCNNEANMLIRTTKPGQINGVMPFFGGYFDKLRS